MEPARCPVVLGVPRADVLGAIGFLALAANLTRVLLVLHHRDDDANVQSVWLCSRNDAIRNLAVVLAAGGVWATSTAWPDLIVGASSAGASGKLNIVSVVAEQPGDRTGECDGQAADR